MEFHALTEADAVLVASWFERDEEGQKEFGGFYGVHPNWWNLVKEDRSRHGWTVWRGSEPVGFADVEVGEDATAGVAVYVRRLRLGEGLATAIMRALGPIAEQVGAVRLKGGIRPDNTASLRAAMASGVQVVGEDKDGYIQVLGPPLRDRRTQ